DASSFSRRFPSILLSAPTGSIDVTGQSTVFEVGGLQYTCAPASCLSFLPPVGRPKAAVKPFPLARWIDPNTKRILITVPDAPALAANPSSSGAIPSVQVISAGQTQLWSGASRVTALQETGAGLRPLILQCEPTGERLSCGSKDLVIGARTTLDV